MTEHGCNTGESEGLAEESNEDRKAAKKGFFPSSMGLSLPGDRGPANAIHRYSASPFSGQSQEAERRKILEEVATIVTLATLLAWHRKLIAQKYDGTAYRAPERPRTSANITELVIRFAKENRSWGISGFKAPWQI